MALELGWSHRAVQHELDNDEYERWRAYMRWRQVQRDHRDAVAAMRAGRRIV